MTNRPDMSSSRSEISRLWYSITGLGIHRNLSLKEFLQRKWSPVGIHSQAYLFLQGYFSISHFSFLTFFPTYLYCVSACTWKSKNYLSLQRFGAVNNYEGPGLPLGNLLWLRKTLEYEDPLTTDFTRPQLGFESKDRMPKVIPCSTFSAYKSATSSPSYFCPCADKNVHTVEYPNHVQYPAPIWISNWGSTDRSMLCRDIQICKYLPESWVC